MRRLIWTCLLAVFAAISVVPVSAATHDDGDKKFTIMGEVRARWEYLSNYTDLQDHDDETDLDDDFNFMPYRVRIAANGQFSNNVRGYIELQNAGYFGNNDTPFETSADPIFQGFEDDIDLNEINLYQGFLEMNEIGGSNWSIRLGRQEHTLGNELHIGDLDFYNGQAFDGARGMLDAERFDLDLFYYWINENDPFDLFFVGSTRDEDITFQGATLNFPIGDTGQVVEPYLLFLRDGDYSGGLGKLYTLGALYGRQVNNGDDIQNNPFDWSVEAAIQTGDFQPNGADVDISANIIEGWFGYNWGDDDSRSRVHVGVLRASGQDSSSKVKSFIPLFGDGHAHNRLGDLDWIDLLIGTGFAVGGPGITDINVGYNWWGGKHNFMAALHQLSLTEDELTGEDDLGLELDVKYGFQYSDHLAFEAGIGWLSAGDLLDDLVGSADDITRAYWQFRLRF